MPRPETRDQPPITGKLVQDRDRGFHRVQLVPGLGAGNLRRNEAAATPRPIGGGRRRSAPRNHCRFARERLSPGRGKRDPSRLVTGEPAYPERRPYGGRLTTGPRAADGCDQPPLGHRAYCTGRAKATGLSARLARRVEPGVPVVCRGGASSLGSPIASRRTRTASESDSQRCGRRSSQAGSAASSSRTSGRVGGTRTAR